MLTIYRRHRANCKMKGRRAKCSCPIWVQGILEGEAVRESLNLTSWEAAQKKARDWEIAGKKNDLTIADAFDRFIADLKSRNLSSDSVRKFERLKDELVESLGDLLLTRLTPDDVAKFREGWKLKPSTAAKKLERFRSFFKFCIDRGWIEKNPARGLKPPKEIAIPVKPYTKEELEKIAWAIPLCSIKGIYGVKSRDRIASFISVLRWTGLRIRDVVQLRSDAVKGEFITLRTQKNGKPVKLPLHPEIKLEANGEYFFWSGEGNPKSCVGDWQRTLRRLSILSAVHIHAHRWRHTFATDLLSKGIPVSEVAAILGNSPRIVEKHYSQWISSRQEAINAAVKATW
jgi:integrase/recombinase XerD